MVYETNGPRREPRCLSGILGDDASSLTLALVKPANQVIFVRGYPPHLKRLPRRRSFLSLSG